MKGFTPFTVAMGLSLLAHSIGLSAYYAFRHQSQSAKLEFNQNRVMELVVLSEPAEIPEPVAAKSVPKKVLKPVPIQPLPEVKPVTIQEPSPILMPAPEVATVVREEPIPRTQEISESPATPEPINSNIPTKSAVPSESADAGGPANYLFNPCPLYPAECRRRKEEGLVLLAVWVNKAGLPGRIRVEQSSGHALLDQAAVHAVGLWRFTPARLGKQPVASQIEIPIRFKLTAHD